MPKQLILVADDDADVRQSLLLLLEDCGWDVATAASPPEALTSIQSLRPALALLDLNYHRDTTSGEEGLALLREIRTQDTELPVVILTGWATVQLAVRAMQLGAQDFLEKPWENAEVRANLTRHLALAAAREQVRSLEKPAAPHDQSTGRLETLTLEQAERYVIRRALGSCGGDVAAAALKLGMSRSALYRRLEKFRK